MKKQLFYIALVFVIGLSLLMILYVNKESTYSNEDFYQKQLVDLNEIVQLSKNEKEEGGKTLEEAISTYKEQLKSQQNRYNDENRKKTVLFIYLLSITFVLIVLVYIYKVIINPFIKLQIYAEEIAKGNFDLDLKYERTNYFGKFTWAFDHMRKEITKARACEKEAIDNNKTVIATLSHDIKTPIASIRAYAEGLDANLDAGPDMRRKYSSIIMRKCDEVTQLTNDLFLHSLSDLDKLKMNLTEVNIKSLLERVVVDQNLKDDIILVKGSIPNTMVKMDEKRFEQVIENLINNAKKYAPESKVEISADLMEDRLNLIVNDHGEGIPDEDIPFIFEKFYRGRNTGDKGGAGLGLYIAKYIMEQMGGSIRLTNTGGGLKVTLTLLCTS